MNTFPLRNCQVCRGTGVAFESPNINGPQCPGCFGHGKVVDLTWGASFEARHLDKIAELTTRILEQRVREIKVPE